MTTMALVNLCFHGVGRPARGLESDEAAYWIGADVLHGVLDLVVGRPDVRISFDDGNASDVELGLPALLDRGLHATFFVVAGRLDRPGSLGSEDVRSLLDAGMAIGTHGMRHVPWRGLRGVAQTEELVTARQVLAEVVGGPVDEAALPLGRYDRRLLGELRRLGYRTVHTSDRSRARESGWLQPRYSVRRGDTSSSVAREILGAPRASERVTRTLVGAAKRWR